MQLAHFTTLYLHMYMAAPMLETQVHHCNHSFLFSPRYLVEQRDVDLNVRDKWDSTPL